MKHLKLFTLLTACSFSFSLLADDVSFKADDNKLETQICVDAATNNLASYKKNIGRLLGFSRDQRKNYEFITNNLSCNDKNIVQFANEFNAEKTTAFMSRYLDKSVIIQKVSKVNNQKEGQIISVTSAL